MIIIPRNYSRMKRARINWKKKKKSRCSEFRNSRKFFLGRGEETEISPIFEYARIGDNARATEAIMRHGNDDVSWQVWLLLSSFHSLGDGLCFLNN